MSELKRKSVDIPEKELKNLQIQAIFKGVSLKVFLESIIINAAKDNKNIDTIIHDSNK